MCRFSAVCLTDLSPTQSKSLPPYPLQLCEDLYEVAVYLNARVCVSVKGHSLGRFVWPWAKQTFLRYEMQRLGCFSCVVALRS